MCILCKSTNLNKLHLILEYLVGANCTICLYECIPMYTNKICIN